MPSEYPLTTYTGNTGNSQESADRENPENNSENNSNSYSSGGGGGGSSSEPTDKERQAIDNLNALVKEQWENQKKIGNLNLETIDLNSQNNRQLADTNILNAKQQAGDDWFKAISQLQDVSSQLNDNAGNMMRGSGLNSLRQLYAKQDDQVDTDTLNALQKNIDTIYGNLAESEVANRANYNEQISKITSDLAALLADTKAQANSINPDLAAEQDYSWLNVDEYLDKFKRDMVEQQRTGWFRDANNINTNGLINKGQQTTATANPLYTQTMNSQESYSRRSQ